jgi:hypothetical protein
VHGLEDLEQNEGAEQVLGVADLVARKVFFCVVALEDVLKLLEERHYLSFVGLLLLEEHIQGVECILILGRIERDSDQLADESNHVLIAIE